MKLGPLLAQFLYRNKRLDLPGIGSFVIDSTQVSESGKTIVPGISFQSDPSVKEDPQLVKFISDESGKMKALASADFQSYLQLALQFLNIGKPFLVEGIGSLVKKNSGGFAFAPGETMQEAMKEYSAREISATSSSEESFHKYDQETRNTFWQKPLVILLILASIGIVVWGGYTLYKNTKNKKQQASEINLDLNQAVDTTRKDSVSIPPPAPTNYKYVLETAPAKRANDRYKQLREYQWNVNIETKDSLVYTIYMLLPVSSGDTTRIIDSLSALAGRRVFIEY